MEKLLEILGKLTIIIVIAPILVIYSFLSWGFVAEKSYNLLIFTHFPNLPILTWYDFALIMLFLNILLPIENISIKKEFEDEYLYWFKILFRPWITLLITYIFYWFLKQ